MPNLEWDVLHSLVTPSGTLDFNEVDSSGHRWQIIPDGYRIVPTLRVTADNLSQADGSVLHPRWKTGLVAFLTVHYQVAVNDSPIEYEPACGEDLRTMHELLIRHLDEIRDYSSSTQARLVWTPSGLGDDRMLTDIQLLSWPDPVQDGPLQRGVSFSIETPFPHAIDSTEIQTAISSGSTVTIANAGNTPQKPVVRVTGPDGAFAIENLTTDLKVEYDSSRPGAASVASAYGEFDFFRGTVFQDGNGADLIAGVEPTTSDFWSLVPGNNSVKMTGAAAVVLSNAATA